MSEKRRPKSTLGVVLIVLGGTVLGLVVTAAVGLAGVSVLFCDAPGMTPAGCLLAGARGGLELAGPLVLPVALGLIGLGTLLRYLSGRAGSA